MINKHKHGGTELMRKTFQTAQLTHEIYLMYSSTHQRLVKDHFGRYQKKNAGVFYGQKSFIYYY